MIAGIDSSSDASLIGISQLQALVKHTTLFQHLKDGIIWRHDPKGQFSVQKLSAILLHSDNGNTFKTIWSIAVPPKGSKWLPPPLGYLKFNVDASVKGNTSGCGGSLRGPNGSILALFPAAATNTCGVCGAELRAIKMALELFVNAGKFESHGLLIESTALEILLILSSTSLEKRNVSTCSFG
ncbi:hypothetical protein Golob_016147, partial [Gossypium lobatum]|nr:hypothetical protein [Gossypium lobatum]